jgi:two-component system, chemotaxis family, sensor kinase CheA
MNDIHNEFILEAREHLQSIEQSMLAIEGEQSPSVRQSLIDQSMRAAHSIKGNAGILGLMPIQQLAHAAESVLETFRENDLEPSLEILQNLLSAVDRLSIMINDLSGLGSHDNRDLIQVLEQLAASSSSFAEADLHDLYRIPLPPSPTPVLSILNVLAQEDSVVGLHVDSLDLQFPIDVDREVYVNLTSKKTAGAISVHEKLSALGYSLNWSHFGATLLPATGAIISQVSQLASNTAGRLAYTPVDLTQGLPIGPILWQSSISVPPVKANLNQNDMSETIASPSINEMLSADISLISRATDETPIPTQITGETPTLNLKPVETILPPGSGRPTSLRVPVDLLDRFMNLVGELTLVRNQAQAYFGDHDDIQSRAIVQRLHAVTSDLQEAALKTRMQPVGNLFDRFPRMVRDLSRQLGKQVELVTVGKEVELDKTVLEQLSDPLTHLIRNCIDHGIESMTDRENKGKPTHGTIRLTASAADGQVIIEIRDDGKGIDHHSVRNKALSLGLATEAELQRMSPKELVSFILMPGFSTAKQVSDVSGRGVGMDVVKTNIERLEGSLTIDSTAGVGTCMTLRVPLTLAIVPCLIVNVGGERFAVPQRGLDEVICLYPGSRDKIELAYDSEMVRLRDLLLPLVRMNEVLARPKKFDMATKAEILASNAHTRAATNDGSTNKLIQYILVLRSADRKFGLLVDEVKGTEEIVVKPMHPSLKRIGIFAGATLMGDGRVALIANIDGIMDHASCSGAIVNATTLQSTRDPAEVHRILLFEYGPKELFGLPLVQIRRIESIAMSDLQWIGDVAFVIIEGVSTRVLYLDKHLSVSSCDMQPEMHLILPKFVNEPMGILVSKIVDTESLSISLQNNTSGEAGILGTALVKDRMVLFLDTQYLRESLFGIESQDMSRPKDSPEITTAGETLVQAKRPARILLVDDTPFFREVVKRYLERDADHEIATAVDGLDGLEKLATRNFDLVVSDIEMPNMDGWMFCQQARQRGIKTPFLALTSLSKNEHLGKARDCGFDAFEEKLDHDKLMQAVHRLLPNTFSGGRG